MRVYKRFILAALMLALGSCAAYGAGSPAYAEGVDYEIRGEAVTARPEIREFYSYWCGHCYAMQRVFSLVESHARGRADFVRNPVGLLGGAMGEYSVRAYAAASLLGVAEEFNRTLFSRIHEQDEIPSSVEDYVDLFASLGVSENQFKSEISAFPTLTMVSQFDRWTEASGIEAVPEVLVNGKYLVRTDNVASVEDLNRLIDYLLTLT